MKTTKRLLATLVGAFLLLAMGVLAQELPTSQPLPAHKRMHQGMGPGAGMEHHEEIADAIAQVRENLAQLQQETETGKIKAGLAENQALLEKVEGLMASRRTMMQLRMAEPLPAR